MLAFFIIIGSIGAVFAIAAGGSAIVQKIQKSAREEAADEAIRNRIPSSWEASLIDARARRDKKLLPKD